MVWLTEVPLKKFQMYCPRCGYEGRPTLRLFTISALEYFLHTLCFIILGGAIFVMISLMAPFMIIFFLLGFLVFVLMVVFIFLKDLFTLVCPKCKYIYVMRLKEAHRDSKP